MPQHGIKQHRLAEKDTKARTAVCRICGPTQIKGSGRGEWRCSTAAALTAKALRDWRLANPEKHTAIEFRRRLGSYGLTPETYEAMLAEQDHRCATCGRSEPGGQGRWHIDHDHTCCPSGVSCGQCIRGLLCSSCNRALGLVRDDPRVLLRMVDYLSNR